MDKFTPDKIDKRMFTDTGSMCAIHIASSDGMRMVDLGNYFKTSDGEKVLITSKDNALRYGHLVDCMIYIEQ